MTTATPLAPSAAGVKKRLALSSEGTTAILAAGLMAVIAMMVLPLPSVFLDLGLTFSFALAILVLSVVIFIDRPLDFSAFPTVLLASLMLRLALNISSTRLIIGEGHTGPDAAGSVIHGFAMFVMGGNIFVGLVVFGVIMIVNFMVITKGAGRMAEVGARFALDGMPGKQLAIDSDVAAGAISHEEAKERRRIEQEETTFFGSLDGASKFVKGDAVAGLLITLLNLVIGMAMGVAAHNLSLADAVETYSILTVGDGLVSQIPSVIISVAAAMLLSKGGAAGPADRALLKEFGAHPVAILTVAGCLLLFAFVPGLPFAPFFMGALFLGGVGAYLYRQREVERRRARTKPAVEVKPVEKPIGDLISLDEIKVEFAPDLVPLALDAASGLEARVSKIRNFLAGEFGFIVPPVRLTDDGAKAPGEYVIKVQGVDASSFRLEVDRVLVLVDNGLHSSLTGTDVEEPVYRAPARWVDPSAREHAIALGLPVVEPAEVLATHLLETIKANFGRLMTRRAARKILDEFSNTSDPARNSSNKQLLDEFVPDKAPVEVVQGVFRLLLEEGVSIRNVGAIVEAVAEARPWCSSTEQIAEFVRRRLSRQITASLKNDEGAIPLVQISPDWEGLFSEYEVTRDNHEKDVALPPEDFNRLAHSVSSQLKLAASQDVYAGVVTFAERRRFVRTVLHAKGINNPVLSYEELDPAVRPSLVGVAAC